MKRRILDTALLGCLLLVGCRSTSDLEVVSGFEIERYLGTWYEAARYPHRFEKDLTSVTATYTRNADGTIRVVNRGYNTGTGEWEQATAVARFKGDPSRGWLKVSFFRPFYASYKILYLDDSYTEAIVTGPTYNYLWILSREPVMTSDQLSQLYRQVHEFGFDTNKLEKIDHSLHP